MFIEAKDDGGGGDNWSYKSCNAPTWLRQMSPLLHKTTLTTACSLDFDRLDPKFYQTTHTFFGAALIAAFHKTSGTLLYEYMYEQSHLLG